MNGTGNEQDISAKSVPDWQPPYPSPELVVAHILADQPLIPTATARRRLAQKITTALRAAGWRILR